MFKVTNPVGKTFWLSIADVLVMLHLRYEDMQSKLVNGVITQDNWTFSINY
jgi:hypothetical protein